MKLLIDLGAIKTGGGAQLALNFLDLLAEDVAMIGERTVLLLPESGPLASYSYNTERFDVYCYPERYLQRFWFENTQLKRICRDHNITHLFTFFGAGLPHPKHVRSVVTTAYPIICYPESAFWQHAPVRTLVKNRINNLLRRHRLRKASTLLVETEVMRSRIAQHLPFEIANIHVIPPVPSRYLDAVKRDWQKTTCRLLLVSGCEPHKNLWRLPEIAFELEKRAVTAFSFVITSDRAAFLAQKNICPDIWDRVAHHFDFIGKVHPRDIQTAYNNADFLINLSDLESFSNNYMEAWKAGLPLIASDRDFARGICGASALYIEPHQPADCAQKIAALMADTARQQAMLETGRRHLANLGDEHQRLARVLSIVTVGH